MPKGTRLACADKPSMDQPLRERGATINANRYLKVNTETGTNKGDDHRGKKFFGSANTCTSTVRVIDHQGLHGECANGKFTNATIKCKVRMHARIYEQTMQNHARKRDAKHMEKLDK